MNNKNHGEGEFLHQLALVPKPHKLAQESVKSQMSMLEVYFVLGQYRFRWSLSGFRRQVEYPTHTCFSLMMKKEIFMRSADWVRANVALLSRMYFIACGILVR